MTFDGLTDMARESERIRQRRAAEDPHREIHRDVDQMPGSSTRLDAEQQESGSMRDPEIDEASDLPMDEREDLQDEADREAAEGH